MIRLLRACVNFFSLRFAGLCPRKGLSLQAGPITNYRIGNEVIVFKRARLAPAAAST
jgi:hypothetical protein